MLETASRPGLSRELPSPDVPELPIEESPALRGLRRQWAEEGDVFHAPDQSLCVLDPALAARFNRENFRDQTLSDRLVDVVRGKTSSRVSWRTLRGAWLERLGEPELIRALADRLAAGLERRVGRRIDFAVELLRISSEALVPTVLDGASGWAGRFLARDQNLKADRVVGREPGGPHFWRQTRSTVTQIAAGWVVRRELKGRAAGRRPRRMDLLDPLVDRLPDLGMDRAVDSTTALLTAVAGPPGSSAVCLAHELVRRPEWRRRMGRELAGSDPLALVEEPGRAAPETHRFVKETLRLWSLPVLMIRPVEQEVEVAGHRLKPGDEVLLSPYLQHRDPRRWASPTVFDPERWKRFETGESPAPEAHAYVPFGWAPRACLGAALGIGQAMLLCRLLTTRFRFTPDPSARPSIRVRTVPEVLHFEGRLSPR